MKTHKFRGILRILLGIALMLGAVGLASYNLWDDRRAAAVSGEVIQQIIDAFPQRSDAQDAEFLDEGVPDYVLFPDMEMPAITIDGYRYIGTVVMPSIEVELPIMEEWDYTRMKLSPCRYSGSVYLNNFVICAHNYQSHFGRLDNLQENDEVIITDVNGNVFRFEVADIETLAGTAVEEMKAGDWDLTLFTCTYSGTARVTVRCRAIK